MKKLLTILLLSSFLFGSDAENIFWDDVKNSNDIELLQLYLEKYPNGTFKSIADLKIRRLYQSNQKHNFSNIIPHWIKGYTRDYKYYSVSKANKHFKGEEYQISLALKRAERKLINKLVDSNLSKKRIKRLMSESEYTTYKDKKNRVYLLLYINNYSL